MADRELPRLDLDMDDLWQQAQALPQTEGAVAGRAGRIAARARRFDLQDGDGKANIFVRRRHLPNGRMAYDVVSDDVDGEYGERRRMRNLRRAAREVRR